MAVVDIQITAPAHDTGFFGTGQVSFQGTVTALPAELDGVALYYRWYSSLFPAEKGRYAMNPDALTDPAGPYEGALGVGTHVITLAAFDRPGETDADLDAVAHGGMTGGSDGDDKCVIHVFIADIIFPGDGAVLSRSGSTLEARAPVLWGKPDDDTGLFAPNDDYHALNRLRYRWEFQPLGRPAGRNTVSFTPALEDYTFIPETDPSMTRIRYGGALPPELTGQYALVLHVEDSQETLGGHTASIRVTVTP
jgi:hypothetical protein